MMKKYILGLLIVGSCVFAQQALAQSCVNSARCDELGYKFKAADCTTTNILACPFDASKVYCARLNEVDGGKLYRDAEEYVKDGEVLGTVYDATDCDESGCLHGKISKLFPTAANYQQAEDTCIAYNAGGKAWNLAPSKDDFTKDVNDKSKIFLPNNTAYWVVRGQVCFNYNQVNPSCPTQNSLCLRPYPNFCSSSGISYTSGGWNSGYGCAAASYQNPCNQAMLSSVEAKEQYYCVTTF